jgi:hypothetical protein
MHRRTITTASWTTPFSLEVWEKLDVLKGAASEDGDLIVLGPTLPDEDDDRSAETTVHRHEEGDLRFSLTVRPRPPGDPPEHLTEHSTRLGGRGGLSAMLASSAPTIGAFHIRCFLSEDELRCPLLPAPVDEGSAHAAALGIGEARLEQVGYRFENGAAGVEEVVVVYLHLRREYSLSISARGPLMLRSPRWLPFADDVVETALTTFFVPVEVNV